MFERIGNYNLCKRCGKICGQNSLCSNCKQIHIKSLELMKQKNQEKEDIFNNFTKYKCDKCKRIFLKEEANSPYSIMAKRFWKYYCKDCWELLTPRERMGEWNLIYKIKKK